MENGIKDTKTVKSIMGQRIQRARGKLSRAKFSDKLNACANRPIDSERLDEMNVERLKQWEYGNNPVALEWIPAICEVLECDVGYLFGEYKEKKREFSDACAITGLSEESIIQLDRMYHDSHFPDGVGLGVMTKGYVIGHVSILDEIIKSKCLLQFLNSLGFYLACGGILPQNAYSSDEQELTPDEHERFFDWANNRGLEIRPRKDISEMYLQTACDELKNMFRDILKKELRQHG